MYSNSSWLQGTECPQLSRFAVGSRASGALWALLKGVCTLAHCWPVRVFTRAPFLAGAKVPEGHATPRTGLVTNGGGLCGCRRAVRGLCRQRDFTIDHHRFGNLRGNKNVHVAGRWLQQALGVGLVLDLQQPPVEVRECERWQHLQESLGSPVANIVGILLVLLHERVVLGNPPQTTELCR